MSAAAPAITGGRLLYAMLRVADLDRSLAFYTGPLGMSLLRQRDYPAGAFTLAFVGYGGEGDTTIELTHNWDRRPYEHGTAFGHIAIGVPDVLAACDRLAAAAVTVLRPAAPMQADPSEIIAFVADPDGYRIELVQVER